MEISKTDRELLKQFKKSLSDVLYSTHSDTYLMKWLRAGNFNLRKCELMYREAMWVRDVYELDAMAYEVTKHEIAEKYEFFGHLGYAKDGTPVSYLALGKADNKGFVYSMSTYDIFKYASQCIEQDLQRTRLQSQKLGKEINEITYIIDMEGFYIKQVLHTCVIEMALDLFRMFQDQYPEAWKNLLVINAAFYFYQAFNLVRPIFRDNILQNISVVSKEDTPKLLLQYIDADELPVFLGGSKVDSKNDPMCSEFLKFGGPIPEECYCGDKFFMQPTDPDVETVWIRPRSCHNHPLIVQQANSRLSVEIQTEGSSILVHLLYKEFGSDSKKLEIPASDEYLDPHDPNCKFEGISPNVKLQTHIVPAKASCRLSKPGLYVYKFDNTCNWLTSRKVIYRLRVLPPPS